MDQEIATNVRRGSITQGQIEIPDDMPASLHTSVQTEMIAAESQRSFRAEVLELDGQETEDQVDALLRLEAEKLGLKTWSTQSPAVKRISMVRTSFMEPQRRSESMDSRTSQSTGFTSTFSGVSRMPDQGRRMSKASLSFRDYDSFMSRGRPNGRLSMSFSPPTTPSHSIFELPLSSPSSSPKKSFLKGISMLRLLRLDSVPATGAVCPHCPRDGVSQRRARHDLPCGHRLCTQALRQTILSASQNPSGAVASCCGKPIPGSLIESVMTTVEQNAVLEKLEQWDKASSQSSPPLISRPTVGDRIMSTESKVDSVGPSCELVERNKALIDLPEYQDLQQQQNNENDRFLAWIDKRRAELQQQLDQLREEMKTRFESVMEDLIEHHATAVTWAEDKQVTAEADMRETHDKEKQNNATGLRHMEAYCAGTYSNGEAHGRLISQQDLVELEKKREVRDGMDLRHQNAINVLRGGQNRRMKLRGERHAREVQDLRRAQRMEELELERACTAEGQSFRLMVDDKRVRMKRRWEVRRAIIAKKAEVQPERVAEGFPESTLPVISLESEARQMQPDGLDIVPVPQKCVG